MPVFGTIIESDFRKTYKVQKHVRIDAMLGSDFFPKHALGDGPALWSFQDSPFRVKSCDILTEVPMINLVQYKIS